MKKIKAQAIVESKDKITITLNHEQVEETIRQLQEAREKGYKSINLKWTEE
jgi:ribosomal 50S subunit-recycling heat shock protein